MIIGIDGSRAFIGKKTGTENYSFQILWHLSKIDHHNTYYVYLRSKELVHLRPGTTATGDTQERSRASTADERSERGRTGETEVAGPGAVTWPSNFKFITISYPRLWTQVGLSLQTLKDPLDVLFVPAHTLPLIRKPGLKTVVTVHDLGAEFLPQTHQLKQRLYLKLMTDYQLKSASKLIAVSEATKKDLVNKVGVPKNNITVIYEGINPDFSVSPKLIDINNTLSKFDLKNQGYFLFVGSIQPRKNLKRLITAYSIFLKSISSGNGIKYSVSSITYKGKGEDKNPSIHYTYPTIPPSLVLAGSKGWLADEIYALPKKLGIKDHVKFLGYVPDKDLPALYRGSQGFLFPSLFEGFGLPVLEAMASHCPVLTSNISSLPEVTRIDNTGHPERSEGSPQYAALLVNPESEDEIAQGILKLYQDKEFKDKLRTRGIAQIKKFSWQKAARETLKVISNLCQIS